MSVQNYHRFYASLNRLPGGNTEDMKETLVSSFTDGRTTSLKEMTQKEYNAMCASLEERTGWKEQLKKKRSLCLKLMQKAGIDTTDWQRINDFCKEVGCSKDMPLVMKVVGPLHKSDVGGVTLGVKDLDALQVKLRAIMSKGGLRPAKAQEAATESQHIRQEVTYIAVPLVGMGQA